MATNVNVTATNFRLGTSTTVTRRLLDLTWTWIDNSGAQRTLTETATFPDILADVPVKFRDDLLIEICTRIHRHKAGVDA